jgi:putative SOS response-associated peptidase YedK
MCGRFTLRTPASELVEIFRLVRSMEVSPRYNIAPTQPVAAVRERPTGRREMIPLHWGLVPWWSKDRHGAARMINARSETVATRPAFRNLFRSHRCLIPADGFYEWQKTAGRSKQPYFISLRDGRPFAFAGLWDRWQGADSSVLESCTILTTDTNDLLRELHDRMPVILNSEDYDRWLSPESGDPEQPNALLAPYPSERMQLWPVSTVVNNARNDAPDCIRPRDAAKRLFE